ncbi:Fc.00g050080.m01.CDS01 [Cosmosporella sp. VM-42]
MAEPFGIIGAIGVASKFVKVVSELALEWKDAPEDIKSLLAEVEALECLLSYMKTDLIRSQDFNDAFEGERSALLSELGDPSKLAAYQKAVDKAFPKLGQRTRGHRLSLERAKHAFLATKRRATTKKLQRQFQDLHRLVMIDAAKLGAINSKLLREERKERQDQNVAKQISTVLAWISPNDYTDQQTRYIGLRHDGTGLWLLESIEFQNWRNNRGRTVFCQGDVGVGKTILTSIVIDELTTYYRTSQDVGIAYIYCDFQEQEKQRADDLLMNILKQLAKDLSSLPSSVKKLYDHYNYRLRRPLLEEICGALAAVAASYSRVFILVDALDGCLPSGRCPGVFLQRLFKLQKACGTNIFATSRCLPEIAGSFKSCAVLQIRAREQDLLSYAEAYLTDDTMPRWAHKNGGLRQEVQKSVIESADGIFELVHLNLESLKGERSENGVRLALKNLLIGAEAYDGVYISAMSRIKRQGPGQTDMKLAKRVLSWIVCAKRQLTTSELQRALAVRTGDSRFEEGNLIPIEDMISVCAGLVTINEGSSIIRFFHRSGHQYFQRTQSGWFPNAETDITNMCITYLSFSTFDSSLYDMEILLDGLGQNSLDDYVARNWVLHARQADANATSLISFFMTSESKIPVRCLLWAARCRHREIVEWLLKQNVEVNVEDVTMTTPLHYAALHGWTSLVELILQQGADVAACASANIFNMTPLHYAVATDSEEIAKRLLDAGMHVDTPVHRRIWERTLKTDGANFVYEPVPKDLDFDQKMTKFRHGLTPLHYAVLTGSPKMTKFFLKHGANPNTTSDYGETPMHIAIKRDLQDLVGSKCAAKGADAWNDSDCRVEVAIDITDLGNDEEYNKAYAAVEEHRSAVVDLLLDHPNIDLAAQDKSGASALHCVRYGEGGSDALVTKLIQKRADVSVRNLKGETPLHLAVLSKDPDSVEALLNHGADIMARDNEGCIPLHYAAQNPCRGILELLFASAAESQADVLAHAAAKDMQGRNVFHHLLGSSMGELVDPSDLDLLLKLTKNAGIDDLNDSGRSPLATYLAGSLNILPKKDSIVKVLLGLGANPSLTTADGLGLGHLAASSSKPSANLLSVLEEYGVDIQRRDANGRTILHHCAIAGSLTYEAMDFLYARRLSADSRDELGKTPLQYATEMSRKYRRSMVFDGDRWPMTGAILRDHSQRNSVRAETSDAG